MEFFDSLIWRYVLKDFIGGVLPFLVNKNLNLPNLKGSCTKMLNSAVSIRKYSHILSIKVLKLRLLTYSNCHYDFSCNENENL